MAGTAFKSDNPEWCKDTQFAELKKLLNKAAGTSIGKQLNFAGIHSYEDFVDNVPVSDYADYQGLIERAKNGEADTLWPGYINKFAISSGTTGSGKHIPITDDRLTSDRLFLRRVVLRSFEKPHRPKVFGGYQLSLPGTIETHDIDGRKIELGEISGFLGSITPWYLKLFQLVSADKLVRMSWKDKFDLVLETSLSKDIRVINAAPPWILILFQKVLEKTGKQSIESVWPNLQAIFCGGVALDNYREALDELTGNLKLDYYENYGASEGYIAFNLHTPGKDLDLVMDNGVFFEWVPEGPDGRVDFKNTPAIPTWEVQKGVNYGLVLTSNSGLWRYAITDLVQFTNFNPIRLKVVGRTSDMLDRFGEALTYKEAFRAMQRTAAEFDAEFSAFCMMASFEDSYSQPHHNYFINWIKSPSDMEQFTRRYDEILRTINRHYDIRRNSLAIASPVLFNLTHNQLKDWITSNPEITQTKMPEIIHDREKAERLLKLVSQQQA